MTVVIAHSDPKNEMFERFFQGRKFFMIALLFALLAVATVLAWKDRPFMAYGVFAITLALSIYWLKFHSTTQLTVVL